jgi:hypothetical protein
MSQSQGRSKYSKAEGESEGVAARYTFGVALGPSAMT